MGEDVRRHYWHPVALASALGPRPLAVTLLGEPLVLWRDGHGRPVAFRDLCIHRGARLSLGQVTEEGELRCPYHGWTYDGSGRCTGVPALPAERPLPAKAKAVAYPCEERYGLIFVCLGTPRRPIFEFPEWGQAGYRVWWVGPFHWRTSAERSTENFMDAAHLPWVHPGLLGNPAAPALLPQLSVEARGEDAFFFELESEVARREGASAPTRNRLTYLVQLPYTVYHENIYPNGDRVVDLFFATPVNDSESLRFMVVARNFALGQEDEPFIRFTTTVWEQDRVVVESQRPEQLPFDLSEELHLKGPDNASVAYRRLMRARGFDIA